MTEYLVKWKGYNNRHNTWQTMETLENSKSLVTEFEQTHTALAFMNNAGPARHLLQSEEVDRQAAVIFGPNNTDDVTAVRRLMNRQGLVGGVTEYLPGYCNEIKNIMRRRMVLLNDEQTAQVKELHSIGRLRMMLELKRDMRKKGRLICQGFREPLEWDIGSNFSPVTYLASVRTLMFANGPKADVISINDVSVAFLQAMGFAEGDERYVAYKAFREGKERVFRLHGPLYGQRCASRSWYETVSAWLESEGYIRQKNEPCLFVNDKGFKVVIWVDDVLCRGSPEETDTFHKKLQEKFECRSESMQVLTPDNPLDYVALDLTMEVEQSGAVRYNMDQTEGMLAFLVKFGLDKKSARSTPMSSIDLLLSDDTPLGEEEAKWVKACLGALHHFIRSTRWDIAAAVSFMSQFNATPTVGAKLALHYLEGYLVENPDLKISAIRADSPDVFSHFTDSGFYTMKYSQTGVMVLLNGAPIHWNSRKQADVADSPAVVEIYALKDGVKDSRLCQWVAEEMGIKVKWPFTVQVDSKQARSFQFDTCPNSRIRGSIDMRETWVDELRNQKIITTEHVCKENQLADILTKPLKGPDFKRMKSKVVNFQSHEILGGHMYLIDLCDEFVRTHVTN